jgi:hypothetical protein
MRIRELGRVNAGCSRMRRLKKKKRMKEVPQPREHSPVLYSRNRQDKERYPPSISAPKSAPEDQRPRFMAELTSELLTSRYPSRRAPTVNCGAMARSSVNVKLAVAPATCAAGSPDIFCQLARANWYTPTGSRRLVDADSFSPTGLRRLLHADWPTPTGSYRLPPVSLLFSLFQELAADSP